MRFVVVAGCCCFALAACGGGSTTTATVTQTVTRTKTVTVAAATTSTTVSAPCLASALAGAFAAVPGSAGAGQITYRLRLTNQGDATCFVSGLPEGQLLSQSGSNLPTNIQPAHPGSATAAKIELAPGDAATADARFSPDVPGSGDQSGPLCEDKAYALRVVVGAGTVDAPVTPSTPVCERGSLFFANYTNAA